MSNHRAALPLSLGLILTVLLILSYTFGNNETQILSTQLVKNLLLETASSPVPALPASPSVETTVLGSTTSANPSSQLYQVVKVTDGDTLKLSINGRNETIRLVGINTPETVDPRRSVECFGQQASQYMKSLVSGKMLRLENDETQSNRDRYQRWLRFVFLPDGTDVGLRLIEEGYAHEALYSIKPHKYHTLYLEAQREAQTEGRGLWNPNVCPQ